MLIEQAIKETLKRFKPNQRFLLGCSGGLDSIALLFALKRICAEAESGFGLRVVHVDHDLQAPSSEWARQVVTQAQALNLDVVVKKVQVASGNLENEARIARYRAFKDVIDADEVLVLAHHKQDQAETVLMRLLSGSGVSGLAAMREVNVQDGLTIVRPLLHVSRADIQYYAEQHQLRWVDDPANHDLSFDRVVLREKVWPVLQAQWPGFEAAMTRTARLMADAESMLTEQGLLDIASVRRSQNTLDIAAIQTLSEARTRWLLSRWMQGDERYAPPLSRVEAVRQMMDAQMDATPVVIWQSGTASYQFRRYQGRLFRLPLDLPKADIQERSFVLEQQLDLATGKWQVQSMPSGLSPTFLGQPLRLRPRRLGESLHLSGRVGRWPLKKLLQSLDLSPWQREQVQVLETLDAEPLALLSAAGFWPVAQVVETSGWGMIQCH
ncbi:tRNA lysidine(34) synthetase TilS [Aquirhabdus parva]|uniref:tRNA(Ile)-lysidine synthase n=1 Tax=Aquirhabdus parva TaxID=2283318 RepID=A0A345P8C7_9GAMM|nr:tRNA lysidine(34) synthetase TilS [Aquirhabdus parva]AXI03536.1 tRNA lysidine(34) synthetase TilS [Aquirhabdus parva]